MSYNQPFFVGATNERFPHRSIDGYLPALEPKDDEIIDYPQEEPWTQKQWAIVNQLRGMVQFLYLKETERRANASKRKTNQYKPF